MWLEDGEGFRAAYAFGGGGSGGNVRSRGSSATIAKAGPGVGGLTTSGMVATASTTETVHPDIAGQQFVLPGMPSHGGGARRLCPLGEVPSPFVDA